MPNILVVEDDENLNRGITFSLKKSGYQVFSAETIKKAKLLSTCPEVLKEFYQQANPVDVEVTMDGNAVRFVPADELETIQSDYSMGKERFVFATCNGDPIYVYDKKIYTCCHGTRKIKDELMAENFAAFLDLID